LSILEIQPSVETCCDARCIPSAATSGHDAHHRRLPCQPEIAMHHPTQRRQVLVQGLALGLSVLASSSRAQAPAWPSRPLKLVAGGPGSVTDIRARWLAEKLGEALGQAVVVENSGAAGGNVGAAQVARAAPDGHTLLMTHQGIAAINPHLFASPGYDALRDFAAVARFGIGALLLAVPAASPAQTVRDLLERPRQTRRAEFRYPGNGSPPHLAAVQFMRMAGFEATHVPYKGGGAMMTALLAGEVDWAIEGLTATLPQVKAGRLRALAVTGARRDLALPDAPTLAEAGVPGYSYIGWTGVVAPAATPLWVSGTAEPRDQPHRQQRRWPAGSSIKRRCRRTEPAEFAAFVRNRAHQDGRTGQGCWPARRMTAVADRDHIGPIAADGTHQRRLDHPGRGGSLRT
jgi:tripartite-type tricarboxylate transporter receptor subunit TctC